MPNTMDQGTEQSAAPQSSSESVLVNPEAPAA